MKDEGNPEGLKLRTKRYALRIIKMFTEPPRTDVARVLGKQVLRSGPSVSRPFPKPTTGRIAVKVINHLGDEVMKVFPVNS